MDRNKCFKNAVVPSLIAIPMLVAVHGNTIRIDTSNDLKRPAIVRVIEDARVGLPRDYTVSRAGSAVDIKLARVGNAVDIELA